MKFTELELKGAYLIELEKFEDKRGFFARTFCKKEFSDNGLDPELSQISIAFNKKKGTLRGMHYMLPPYKEAKLVRCSRGKIYDVIIDLRPESKTFKKWYSTELSQDMPKMIYLPEGFAHGYQTLAHNTEVIYHMSILFVPEYYTGVRWNDPAFKIKWPDVKDRIISEKDNSYPDFKG